MVTKMIRILTTYSTELHRDADAIMRCIKSGRYDGLKLSELVEEHDALVEDAKEATQLAGRLICEMYSAELAGEVSWMLRVVRQHITDEMRELESTIEALKLEAPEMAEDIMEELTEKEGLIHTIDTIHPYELVS